MTVRLTRVNGALRWHEDTARPDVRVTATCPICGADTEFVTSGSRRHWQQAAVIRCSECAWRGVLNVELLDAREMGYKIGARQPAVCGTESGYQRHRKQLGEPACDECKAAHSRTVSAHQPEVRAWRRKEMVSA